MTDIAELGIRIDARQVRQGGAALDDFANRGARAERATVSMEGAVKSLGKGLAALALVAKAIDFGADVVKAQRDFDKLNASLITATGSVGNATQAFAALQRFAASTPYSLAEVSEGFIKLRNLGLTPSERALTSYGNTASAMGKSLNQMIEAVADASTGEFERLKEFGIKAKQNGDQVALTFQGTTTTVANNAAAIEGYLMKLGETKFAGGMELQANTLNGAISNLADTWDQTLLTFAQSGFGDVAMRGVLALSGALTDLQAILKAVTGEADTNKQKLEELGPVHKALTTIFEAAAVMGANVSYVLKAIGSDIGAFAAAVVAAASGDFQLAGQIAKQRKLDAIAERQEIDARTAAILGAADTARASREKEQAEKAAAGRDDLARFVVQTQGIKQVSAAQKKASDDALSWAKKTAAAGALELSIMRAEQDAMGDLTDAQKNAIKVRAEMAKYGDLIPAKLKKVINSHLDETQALERVNLERAQYIALMSDAANAAGADIAAANDATKSLQEQVKYYGQTEVAVLRLKAAEYERQLAAAGNKAIEVNRLFQLKAATEDQIALQEQLTAMKADTSFWQSLNDTARQTFLSIADGSKDLGTRLKDTLKNTFFDWLYQMTLKKWIINIGTETSGLSTIAGQAGSGGGVGSLLSNLTSLMGNGSGSLSSILTNGIQTGFDKLGLSMGSGAPGSLAQWGGAAGSTLAGYGIGNSLNSGISGKYSVGGSGVQKAITVGASAYFGPIGGAVAGAILGAVNRAFGRGPKEATSQGLQGTFGADSFSGSNYTEWVKKGGWFRSDKRGTDTAALSTEQAESLNTAYKAIKDSTSAFASALGLPTSVIDSYTKTIKLVSTGDAAKDQAALTQLFVEMGDELAGRVLPNVVAFIQQGETAAGALERVSAEFQTVDVVLTAMGVSSQQAFGAIGVASLAARDRLVLAAGGLEAFAAKSDFFAQNFLSQAERLAPAQKAVAEQMAAMGYASVTTNEQFKDVVMGLMQSGALATEAGAKTYAGLLAVAPAFKMVADAAAEATKATAEAAAEAAKAAAEAEAEAARTAADAAKAAAEAAAAIAEQRATMEGRLYDLTHTAAEATARARQIELAALDASLRPLQERIYALEDERAAAEAAAIALSNNQTALMGFVDAALAGVSRAIAAQKASIQAAYQDAMAALGNSIDTVNASIAKTSSLSSALKSALRGMTLDGQEGAGRAAAQAQLQTALAIAKAGGMLPDADSIQSALAAATQSSPDDFASFLDYQRDFAKTASVIAELSGITDSQLTDQQRQLELLKGQKELAQKAYEAEVERLDGLLTTAQQQVDAIHGVDNSVLGVSAAIATLSAAIGALKSGATPSNPGGAGMTVEGLYQSVLGRSGDAAGLAFWKQAYGDSVDQTEIADFITAAAPELAAKDNGTWKEWLRAQGVPGYAAGGVHGGGWRVVGENGPELENTGPSRVYSNGATTDLFAGVEARLTSLETVMATGLSRLIAETKRGSDAVENIDERGVATRDETEIG